MFTALANAGHAGRTGERYFHVVLPLIVGAVAFILGTATTSLPSRYVSMMLMVPGVYIGCVVVLAWISNTLPRPPAKRAAALAMRSQIRVPSTQVICIRSLLDLDTRFHLEFAHADRNSAAKP